MLILYVYTLADFLFWAFAEVSAGGNEIYREYPIGAMVHQKGRKGWRIIKALNSVGAIHPDLPQGDNGEEHIEDLKMRFTLRNTAKDYYGGSPYLAKSVIARQ